MSKFVGTGPSSYTNNLPGRGLIEVEKHCSKLDAFLYLKKEAAPAFKMWYFIKIRHCTALSPEKTDYFGNH